MSRVDAVLVDLIHYSGSWSTSMQFCASTATPRRSSTSAWSPQLIAIELSEYQSAGWP